MKMNELDALLEGIDITVPPEGVLANEALTVTAKIESLADEQPAPKFKINKAALYEAQTNNLSVGADEDTAPVTPLTAKEKKQAEAAAAKVITDAAKAEAKVVAQEARSEAQKTKLEEKAARQQAKEDAKSAELFAKGPAIIGSTEKLSKSAVLSKHVTADQLSAAVNCTVPEAGDYLSHVDGLPKKVSEKAYNLIRYAAGRETISNVTATALTRLRNISMTVPDLVAALQTDRGYSIGTARSQAQQMSKLFSTYGMTHKVDGKMSLVVTHPLVKAALKRLAA